MRNAAFVAFRALFTERKRYLNFSKFSLLLLLSFAKSPFLIISFENRFLISEKCSMIFFPKLSVQGSLSARAVFVTGQIESKPGV